MKQTPQMQEIQDKMKPGVITLHGFLGDDTRNLIDILVEDEAEVRRLGCNHKRISQRMAEFRSAGMKGLGYFISVDPHFESKVDTARGKLPCPFGHPGMLPKTNTTIRNLRSEREITFSDLNIHLIEEHGFYEGKGSLFRLEPKDIVEILEIE